MAKEEKKEEYTTVPPTSQTDLERRLGDDEYTPDSALPDNTVNPNPFGEGDYAGTDPIYQNYANDVHKPLRAEEGPDQAAEEFVRDLHNTDDVDDADLVHDYGMGGVAVRAKPHENAGATAYLVPGQEGYDKAKAEEQSGPPMRVDTAESGDSEDVKTPPPPTPDDPTGAAVNPSGAQKDPK